MTDSLEKLLREAEKPNLTSQSKELIRQKLFCRLAQPSKERPFSLVELIGRMAGGLVLSPEQRARIKEKVFALIEGRMQRRFFWPNFFLLNKKLVSLSLAVLLVFASMSFLNVETKVVYAGGFTQLDFFKGSVFVERQGKSVPAYLGMRIVEEDKIVTADNGQAVVRYFDKSVTRLAANTKLLVNKLRREGFSKSRVELSLLDGTLWSKVMGWDSDKSSFVVEAKNVYATAGRSSFNMELSGEDLEIKVFNHAVAVRSGDNTEEVSRGEKVVVPADVNEEVHVIEQIGQEEKNEAWVQQNLQSDREYTDTVEKEVLDAKIEAVGMNGVGDDLPVARSFRESALLLLTFDGVKQEKTELDLAERHFVAAQVKFHDPDLSEEERLEAEKAIKEFADQGQKFNELIKQVGIKDKEYAGQLKSYLDEKIANHKKDLSFVMPDSPLYQTKGVVDELQLLAAETDAEVAEIKLEQATEALAVVEDVVDTGDEKLADQAIADYKEEVTDVAEVVDAVEEIEVKEQLVQEVDGLVEAFSEVSGEQKPAVPLGDEAGDVAPAAVAEPLVADVAESDVQATDDVQLHEGPYGVTMQGNKPLPPILGD